MSYLNPNLVQINEDDMIKKCPICHSVKLKRTKEKFEATVKGEYISIPNVTLVECQDCNYQDFE